MNTNLAENFVILDSGVSTNNQVAVNKGLSGAIQTARVPYTITAADIALGFAFVTMPFPFIYPDTNYTAALAVSSEPQPAGSDFAPGCIYNRTPAGFSAVLNMTAAIPLVQGQVDLVNSTATLNPISLTVPLTTMYQVTFYYGPADNTGAGTWTPLVSWQDPTGNNLNSSTYFGAATAGSTGNFQSFSTPFYVKAGTPLVVTGSYSGAAFPMNVSIRVVQMPNNQTVYQPGQTVYMNVIAIHD
jgi:hypothetical protein